MRLGRVAGHAHITGEGQHPRTGRGPQGLEQSQVDGIELECCAYLISL